MRPTAQSQSGEDKKAIPRIFFEVLNGTRGKKKAPRSQFASAQNSPQMSQTASSDAHSDTPKHVNDEVLVGMTPTIEIELEEAKAVVEPPPTTTMTE